MKGKFLFFVSFLLLVCIGHAQEPVFLDSFDKDVISKEWKLDSPHNWKIENGVLIQTKYGGGAEILKDFGESFIVEIKVKLIKPDPERKGGFGGVNVGGINFVMRKGGFWWPYLKPGAKRYSGGFKKEDIQLNRWYNFKIERRAGGIYIWYVDDKKICEIIASEMGKNISLRSWRFKTAYDDVKVYVVKGEKKITTLNILRNSSFEIMQDNLFPYWAPSGNVMLTYGGIENFLKEWRADRKEKYDGKQSLRIKKGGVYSWYFNAEKGAQYIFSVYLKSDVENLPVSLGIWEWNIGKLHKKKVMVGKEWKRYECITKEGIKTNALRVRIEKEGEGTLWVDAAQLEKGTVANPYVKNPFDTGEIKIEKKEGIPEVKLAVVNSSPVIDGKLNDNVWKNAVKSPPFLVLTQTGKRVKPKEPTEAYLCTDGKNLLIGIKCYDSQIDKIRANVKEDGGPVWSDDSVEIFIDTNFDRKTYYHFAINSLGKIYVQNKEKNLPWKREIKVATDVNKKEKYWSVEVAIPLSSLDLSPLTSTKWGINLGRENPKINEYSCNSPVSYMNFHDVKNYTIVKWPDKKIFEDYFLDISDIKLIENERDYTIKGEIINKTPASKKVEVEVEFDSYKFSTPSLNIEKGKAKKFVCGNIKKMDKKEYLMHIIVKDKETGQIIKNTEILASVVSPVEFVMDRNYYTSERYAEGILKINTDKKFNSVEVKLVKNGREYIKKRYRKTIKSIKIPLKNIPEGDYTLKISLLNGREKVGEVSQILKKLQPQPNEVKIDYIHRFLIVDGKPYFAFAPLTQFFFGYSFFYKGNWEEKLEKTIKYYADNGFKTLVAVSKIYPREMADKGWTKLFEVANKYKIKLIAWPGFRPKEGLEKHFDEFIKKFKDEPSLLVWCVADEPEIQKDIKPDDIAKLINITKKADPYHPVYVNYTPIGPSIRYAGLPGDIISTDLYITGGTGRPIREVVDIVKLKEKIAKKKNMLVWMWLVGNNTYNHFREPTAEEQEAQTYGAIISGCTGLKYFYGSIFGYKNWMKLKQLNREISLLTPVIASDKIEGVKSNHPDILVMARKYRGDIYVFTVNINKQPLQGKIDLTSLSINSENAEVLFESRNVSIKNSILIDNFKGCQRHIYKIKR